MRSIILMTWCFTFYKSYSDVQLMTLRGGQIYEQKQMAFQESYDSGLSCWTAAIYFYARNRILTQFGLTKWKTLLKDPSLALHLRYNPSLGQKYLDRVLGAK